MGVAIFGGMGLAFADRSGLFRPLPCVMLCTFPVAGLWLLLVAIAFGMALTREARAAAGAQIASAGKGQA